MCLRAVCSDWSAARPPSSQIAASSCFRKVRRKPRRTGSLAFKRKGTDQSLQHVGRRLGGRTRSEGGAAMDYQALPAVGTDGIIHVVIECPRGAAAKLKYEPALN